jgi:hypothetical protein
MAKLHQTKRSVYVKILPSRLPCLAGGLYPWWVRKDTFQGKIGGWELESGEVVVSHQKQHRCPSHLRTLGYFCAVLSHTKATSLAASPLPCPGA